MTVAPATEAENGAKRRIGDILLELGFVGEEALAKAAEEQEKSGQPLGQILVEHGAITRLELASALAEQWSDQVSITPLPAAAPPRAVPQQPRHHDDDQYAARLQEAVADLTQRVRMPDTENPLDSRLVELAERVEATVARTQRLEATVATLVENLEGMTSGVEEAFSVLQSGMSGLAMDLARMETTIVDLTARQTEPATDPALTARIDDLWKLVHELSDRPLVDEDARGRADELAAQLEALADRASLEQVEGSLDGLRSSLDDLGDLRAAVAELETRPTGSPEVDARLERLEARLNEYGAAAGDTSAVESLTGRLDAALATQSALEASLGAIDQRLELLAQDLASRSDASLAEHVATVEGRLAGLVSGEDLSLALERTRDELASMPPESDPRLDDLARELASVRDELHEATAARLGALEARLQAELASSTDPEAAKALAALSDRLEELSRDRHHQEELVARLDGIESRLPTDAVSTAELTAALERTRAELAPKPQEPDPRVDDLARELASVRDELHEATAARLDAVEARLQAELASSTDPEAAQALASLSERIEELSGERHHQEELAARLDGIESRLPTDTVSTGELAAALERTREELAPKPQEPDPRVDDLARELASVRDELHEATAARLDAVEARLQAELASSTDPEAAKALAALSERIEELSRDRHAHDELTTRLDDLAGRLAGAVTGDELASAIERTREELAPAPLEPDPRIDATAARLETIEARLEAGLASSTDPEAAHALASLSERIEELSRERHAQEELAAKLAALESRLPTDTVTAGDLAAAVEELRAEQAPAAGADTGLEDAVAGLTEKLVLLEELQTRVDALAETVAAEPAAPAGLGEEARLELEERLATLASTVEEKLAVASERPGEAGGLPENMEEDIERFRMTLERLSMHLAEHDRTLSEMRSARGVTQRLDELAAQVDSLAAGVSAEPDGAPHRREPGFSRDLEPNEMRQLIRRIEDCEEAAHEGREKLMNRLERMASSIDWRLQRLEADEPAE